MIVAPISGDARSICPLRRRRRSASPRTASRGCALKCTPPTSCRAVRRSLWPPVDAHVWADRVLSGVQILARKRLADQVRGFGDAVERDEGTHARARALSDQDFVESLEPGPEFAEGMTLADFVDALLDCLGRAAGRQRLEFSQEIGKRSAFQFARPPIAFGRL